MLVPRRTAKDSRLHALLWSAMEGLSQRGATAIATFALAALSGPATVGAVAAAVLALGVGQAACEVPLRQAGQRLFLVRGGPQRLNRWAFGCGVVGSVVVLGTIGAISLGYVSGTTALQLLPFALVPLVSATEVSSVVRLQHAHRWRFLAAARAVAGGAALAVGVGIALLTRSALAMSMQFLVAESVFAVAAIFVARREAGPAHGRGDDVGFVADFRQTAISSLLSWSRGQSDRVGIGAVARPAVLGSYTLATSMSRAPAEAMLSGAANAFRVHLAIADDGDLRAVVQANERRIQALMLGAAAVSIVAVFGVAQFLLGPRWDVAIGAVPLFAASVFATAHSLVCGVLLNHLGQSRRAYPTQALEIVVSIGIAFAVLVDFRLAAALFILREVSAATAMSWYVRAWLTRRTMLLWLVPTGVAMLLAVTFEVL